MGLALFAKFRTPMVSGHGAAKLEVSRPSPPPSVTVKVLTGTIPTSLVVFHDTINDQKSMQVNYRSIGPKQQYVRGRL